MQQAAPFLGCGNPVLPASPVVVVGAALWWLSREWHLRAWGAGALSCRRWAGFGWELSDAPQTALCGLLSIFRSGCL